MSRICEEFPAYTPLTALHDLDHGPANWLYDVIEARHFAKAFAEIERPKRDGEPEPEGRYVDLYYEFKGDDWLAGQADDEDDE